MAKGIYASGEGKISLSFDGGTTYTELDNKNITNIGITIDGEEQTWTGFNNGGWQSSYMTAKSASVSIDKNLNLKDATDQKLVETILTKNAYDHNYVSIKFEFPIISDLPTTTPATWTVEGVLKPGDILSSAAEDMAPLNFEIVSNGKPVYVKEVVPTNVTVSEADLNVVFTGSGSSKDYTFNASVASGNVTVSAAPAGGSLSDGQVVTFTLTPASGYVVNSKVSDTIEVTVS